MDLSTEYNLPLPDAVAQEIRRRDAQEGRTKRPENANGPHDRVVQTTKTKPGPEEDRVSRKTYLVEVVQAYSKQLNLLQTLGKTWTAANKSAGQRRVTAAPPPPNKISQRLSADDVASIVAAYQGGATSTGLAKQYGIGKATVLRLLDEAGVQRRRQSLTREQVGLAIHLYGLGWSLEQVGQKLGYDHGTVMRALDRAGVPRRDTHGRPR